MATVRRPRETIWFTAVILTLAFAPCLHADIYDRITGLVIDGTELIIPGPGIQMDHLELVNARLSMTSTSLGRISRRRISPMRLCNNRH